MDREYEKKLSGLSEFLGKNKREGQTTEETNRMIYEYLNTDAKMLWEEKTDEEGNTAEDYLDLAEEARSKKQKLEYLKKALALEPQDLDIMTEIVMTENPPIVETLKRLEELIAIGEKQMNEGGYFRNHTGDFWLVVETRPYMRLLDAYFSTLVAAGMFRRAIDAGNRILHLCEGDNLGIRYEMMHLYAYLEEEKPMTRLHKAYDRRYETQMLLPLSILYFKRKEYEKSLQYLKKLAEINKDAKTFIGAMASGRIDEYIYRFSPFGYTRNSMEELLYAMCENGYLYSSIPHYYKWAKEQLKIKRKNKAETSR